MCACTVHLSTGMNNFPIFLVIVRRLYFTSGWEEYRLGIMYSLFIWYNYYMMYHKQPIQRHVNKSTFNYLCTELRPLITRETTVLRELVSVEERVAVTLRRLATNVEYRTKHLFLD